MKSKMSRYFRGSARRLMATTSKERVADPLCLAVCRLTQRNDSVQPQVAVRTTPSVAGSPTLKDVPLGGCEPPQHPSPSLFLFQWRQDDRTVAPMCLPPTARDELPPGSNVRTYSRKVSLRRYIYSLLPVIFPRGENQLQGNITKREI